MNGHKYKPQLEAKLGQHGEVVIWLSDAMRSRKNPSNKVPEPVYGVVISPDDMIIGEVKPKDFKIETDMETARGMRNKLVAMIGSTFFVIEDLPQPLGCLEYARANHDRIHRDLAAELATQEMTSILRASGKGRRSPG